jgi:hypothetical protein
MDIMVFNHRFTSSYNTSRVFFLLLDMLLEGPLTIDDMLSRNSELVGGFSDQDCNWARLDTLNPRMQVVWKLPSK